MSGRFEIIIYLPIFHSELIKIIGPNIISSMEQSTIKLIHLNFEINGKESTIEAANTRV